MSDAREKQKFLQFLRDRGQRVTGERLALFDEIFSQHRHIDAEELLGAMKERGLKISRATVYRNLDLLVECGLARKQRLGQNRFLYEHVHGGQQHDHLVCAGCGRVVEFISPGIAALQAEICRAHGFVPSRHTLQISGLCNECAQRESQGVARPAVSEAGAVHV
jgi:Fur family ferric uptake transcriptional regulator